MTIKQLHYFIAVAETKSFTHAARNYFIAQTAMSQQISALEKELGFRLFHRTNRVVELTEAGALLFARVRPLVLELEDALQSAAAEAGVENHVFRVGLSDQAVNRFLAPALQAFARIQPRVTPLLIADNHLLLLESLAEGGLDVMFLGRRYYTPRAMLSATELFDYQVLEHVLAVPADHPLASRNDVEWSDLEGLHLIAYSPLREDQRGASLTALLTEHGVTANRLCSTRTVETALLYVEAGLGCCLLPAFAGDQSSPEVRMLPVKSDLRDTMLLLHHREAENPITGEFVSVCRQTLHGPSQKRPPESYGAAAPEK